jgi:hypothetical protein
MLTLYDAAIPTYRRLLTALSDVLDKAVQHAAHLKYDPQVLLAVRLYPNMWSLAQQIGGACTHSVKDPYLVVGKPVPEYTGPTQTIDDQKAKIAWALGTLDGIDAAAFNAAAEGVITFPMAGQQRKMTGRNFLLTFSLDNVYFHCATAYDILRHNGVPLVKSDFTGKLTFAE